MNLIALIGRPTRDPDVRYSTRGDSQEQMAIARFTLAVDRQGDGADFISCVAFGKNAEFYQKYIKKGMKVAVEGSIRTGSYNNSEGKKIYTTDVIVSHTEFCEKKSEGQQQAMDTGAGSEFMYVPEGIEEDLPFA